MNIALECPTPLLSTVQPFADFDWILTHKVKEDEEYKDYYLNSTKLKVLDNSVNELGEPVTIKDMEEAFKEVNASIAIPPDWIGNSQKTMESFVECAKAFGAEGVWPVVQGNTFEEVRECIRYYVSSYQGRPFTLCIPYDICSKKDEVPSIMALRRTLVTFMVPAEIAIHLLGFLSVEELYWYQGRPNIRSLDTGAPVLLGLQEKDILDPLESKASPTLVEMESLEAGKQVQLTAIYRNIGLLRMYTNG